MNANKAVPNAANKMMNTVAKAPTSYKIGGVVMLLLVVILIIYLIIWLRSDYLNTKNSEPYLVYGTKIARTAKIIPGNQIKRSVDSQYGIEFSYSMWIYVTDWTYKNDEYKHILHKGNDKAIPLQSPGIWLYPKENKIAINMNTFYSVKESCDVGNIPIGKWFHLTMVVVGKNIDVYINGRLKKRCALKGVPKLNFGDVYINSWNGFDGFLSNVRYFNYALPYYKIESIVSQGPSKAPCVDSSENAPPYLANDWWMTTGFPSTSW